VSSGEGRTPKEMLDEMVGSTIMFVLNVHRVLLNREPDVPEMEMHVNAILSGQSPMEFFRILATSQDHRVNTTKFRYKSEILDTMTNHDFVAEPRFVAAMESAVTDFEHAYGTHPPWNFHVLLWVASQAMKLPGDLVQCGVFNGTDAAAIVQYTNFGAHPDKRLYLLDTFVGVPEEQWTPTEIARRANAAQWLYKEVGDRYFSVVERFKAYPNVRVIRGKVPDTLDQVDSPAIATLFLDMNCAAPEAAAMEFFWERIVPGGMIFSDDYGHSMGGGYHFEQKQAFDEFAARVGLEVLSLPTGQGLLVKA
jgi:hypothetical protein